MDPQELWKRWYDAYAAGANAWLQRLREDQERYADPFGLLGEWAKTAAKTPDSERLRDTATPPEPLDLWRRWFDMMAAAGKQAAGGSAAPWLLWTPWLELLQQTAGAGTMPGSASMDPLALFQQWYEANAEAWTKAAEEMVGSAAFIEASSRLLDASGSAYRALRLASERFLRNAQMPALADIARVAGLVVALEDKVDRIEELVETAQAESAQSRAQGMRGTADTLERLEARLSRVESKLDELLMKVEQTESREPPVSERAGDGSRRPSRRTGSSSRSGRSNGTAASRRAGRASDGRPSLA